ncbi:MAG TPA: ABC transporter ATP-binding protein [Acidimicrobiales bacterium]|nr:ABC transporter ATP-binding protein [Acidimicrobiales bacterium]
MELEGVTRRFGELQVLQPTSLAIPGGGYVAITGSSGSGKSTLLHLLGLLDKPSTGTYRFDGQDIAELGDDERATLRGRSIGFVFQAFHLLAARTAAENVEFGMLYQGVPQRERRERATDALERVGLPHRDTALARTLSGGERQRVAIARALAADARMILADEPTGNLDSVSGEVVLGLFDDLHASGLTLVVVTHNPEVAARALSPYSMRDGVLAPQLDGDGAGMARGVR